MAPAPLLTGLLLLLTSRVPSWHRVLGILFPLVFVTLMYLSGVNVKVTAVGKSSLIARLDQTPLRCAQQH